MATGEEDLRQKLGALQPNTGLVVNSLESDSIRINNQTYARGDIIFKDINNQHHHIPSYSGGYYYPSAIQAHTIPTDEVDDNDNIIQQPTGSYILTYAYATSAPTVRNATLTAMTQSVPAQQVTIEIDPAITETSYGLRQAVHANGESATCHYIPHMQPIVAWYMITDESNNFGERVYFDEEYSINTDSISCHNPTTCDLWVEVR